MMIYFMKMVDDTHTHNYVFSILKGKYSEMISLYKKTVF